MTPDNNCIIPPPFELIAAVPDISNSIPVDAIVVLGESPIHSDIDSVDSLLEDIIRTIIKYGSFAELFNDVTKATAKDKRRYALVSCYCLSKFGTTVEPYKSTK